MRSFGDAESASLWSRDIVDGVSAGVQRIALRKLAMLDAAVSLEDLRQAPSNDLTELGEPNSGQYSIRIDQAWRIRFGWTEGGAQPSHAQPPPRLRP